LERIEFRGPSGLTDMMAEYADVDIALDPAPYNGGTTSLQAMWMGAPVLTVAGGHFVSRMGASFMQAAGLAEWVATDDADLVRRAVALSKNRKDLLALKQGLRQRLTASPAWDIDAYTRDMQSAIRHMWMASSSQSHSRCLLHPKRRDQSVYRRSAVADVVTSWRRGRVCGTRFRTDCFRLLRYARNDRGCFATLAMTN
jgi:hypothetical protein